MLVYKKASNGKTEIPEWLKKHFKNTKNHYTYWVETPDGVSNFIIIAAAPISACLT